MSTASIYGVTFRLSHIPHVLRGEAWQCLFCGRKSRTCTEATREESMRKHAAKANHVWTCPLCKRPGCEGTHRRETAPGTVLGPDGRPARVNG